MPFKFNYGYHPYVSFKDKVGPHLKSRLANKLDKKLKDLILIH